MVGKEPRVKNQEPRQIEVKTTPYFFLDSHFLLLILNDLK
jgi:hypothetical protein